ncbi:hypothetical protein WJX72_000612 [[Myrmecia] bisecta]|uniref:Uncharacterized protein n=1 Tax=[Myrmecia] bisecta TaxID=41462 RepID=A0AAW1QDY9_9CHLO
MPSLGTDGVKGDAFHWLNRICRAIPRDHALKGEFLRALSRALFSSNTALDTAAIEKAILKAKPNISPADLHAAVASADPDSVVNMYHAIPVGGRIKWLAVHGSSKLEGYHRHLNALLSVANTSPALAEALIDCFNGRWNIDSGIRNKGGVDYGMYDHELLEQVNAAAKRCGLPAPYPDFKPPAETTERFGFSWWTHEVELLHKRWTEQLHATQADAEPSDFEDIEGELDLDLLLQSTTSVAKAARPGGGPRDQAQQSAAAHAPPGSSAIEVLLTQLIFV